MVNRGN